MINQEEYEVLKELGDKRKWIARDGECNSLNVFSVKPIKVHSQWDYMDVGYEHVGLTREENKMFQFVQWEDEEPHSIAELIEEYEGRGDIVYAAKEYAEYISKFSEKLLTEMEEEEMKKDKEWLKEEIESKFHRWYNSTQSLNSLVADVNNSINQLDEPEVLSQELPEIPKYVADWIVDLKSKKINLLESIYDFTHGEDINNYMREQGNVLMRAWLNGFIIANEGEEQLFYALVKGHELCSDLFKYWNCKAYNTGHLLVGSKYPKASCINRMTKTNWNKLGINDSNADFVRVEELEE